jgi:LmbE family N-acetylglucosaminyl deacetylase
VGQAGRRLERELAVAVLKLELAALPSPCRILAIGCHPDDIEIGCGGTILRLVDALPDVEVVWVVLTGAGARAEEVHSSAAAFLDGVERRQVVTGEFRDGFLPYTGYDVKQFFEDLKPRIEPDLIFTHYRHDLHQDHRLACELTWNTFRHHLILEYEIPKYDGDLGSPNVFVQLTEGVARAKVARLLEHFETQLDRHWFTEDLFLGLMRLRGMESSSPSRFAEGFYGRKVVL